MLKAFITDVDGTLFDHGTMRIPEANIRGIKRLQEQNIMIIIATARTYASSLNIVDALQLREHGGFLIASNGGTIYDLAADDLVYRRPIPMNWVHELYEYALANDLHFNVEQDDYVVASGYDPGIKTDNQIVGVDFFLTSPHNDYFKRVVSEPYKVSFTQTKALIDRFYPLAETAFGDRLYICHAGDNFIDIVLKDVNKSTAVAQLLKMLNLNFSEVAAIGDGDNDSWLLANAGYSAAIAGATAKAQAAAKHLVGSCANGGVGEFIDFLLKQ